jgi:putative oligomerization/nucleic acid binding protein
MGGGFGAAGAAEGMAIAAMLNSLTTRVKIKTVLRIEAAHAELFFLNTQVEPEALRIRLSPALGAIRQAKSAASEASSGEDRPQHKSAAERLAEVTRLHDAGLLTDEEYQAKRAEIISQL